MFCTTFSHYFTKFVGVGAKVEAAVDVARPVANLNRVVLAGTRTKGERRKKYFAPLNVCVASIVTLRATTTTDADDDARCR